MNHILFWLRYSSTIPFLACTSSLCRISAAKGQRRPWLNRSGNSASKPSGAFGTRSVYRGRREAPLAVKVRDRLGQLFPEAAFAEAFGKAGKPGWSPGRLALVTVLQKAANLTDRQAANEVRENLAWKYALGLGLEDPGVRPQCVVGVPLAGGRPPPGGAGAGLAAGASAGAGPAGIRRKPAHRLHAHRGHGAGPEPAGVGW